MTFPWDLIVDEEFSRFPFFFPSPASLPAENPESWKMPDISLKSRQRRHNWETLISFHFICCLVFSSTWEGQQVALTPVINLFLRGFLRVPFLPRRRRRGGGEEMQNASFSCESSIQFRQAAESNLEMKERKWNDSFRRVARV